MASTTEQGYQNLTLCVPKCSSLATSASPAEHLAHPTVVSSHVQDVGVGGVIAPNNVLLRVERFGFSANNVTYGLLGEDPHFRYFEFHPAPATNSTSPKTHGIIPVWGFATVIQSTHPSIQSGERVFGYLGMSRYLVLPVETIVNKYNFYVPRPHLPSDRRPYNQITRCNADPLYDPRREDELMIFRPLFWTSFWCEDWLHTTGAISSGSNVLISSASAKTAYCLAFVIDLRRKFKYVALPKGKKWMKNKIGEEYNSPKLIGLTSQRNLRFTQGLGLYDEVLTYEQVEQLTQKGSKWVYVDVAGNNGLNSKISQLLGSKVIKGVSLGMSDPSGKVSGPGSNQKLELFFMVEWLAERRKYLNIKEIAQMQAGAWDALMRTCDQWIKIERVWWAGAKSWMDESKGVTDLYQECLEGSVGPDRGIIMSMWREEDLKTSDKSPLMMLKKPPLPPPNNWFPGHMAVFAKNLPQLLRHTHVVLEARDARLPLTSINPKFEALLKQWHLERGSGLAGPVERIVVYNKMDLVPDWGIEPFKKALRKHFDHSTFFTTAKLGKSIGSVHNHLTEMAKKHKETTPHLNVLVIGMPNVGKSTILNHLRSYGVRGASSSALRTSRLPGMTKMTSNRMRICDDPLIYSVDSPGVMLPFLGYGDEARERAVKISLILGIKESLFDYEQLAAYLLYRINSINSLGPPYPPLLANPTKSRPIFAPTDSIDAFLEELAERMGYMLPGGIPDKQRTATWFVEWWRNSAAEIDALGGSPEWGWGLDCQWDYDPHSVQGSADIADMPPEKPLPAAHQEENENSTQLTNSGTVTREVSPSIEEQFARVIERHLRNAETLDDTPSEAQLRKQEREQNKQRREQRRVEASNKRAQTQKRRHR